MLVASDHTDEIVIINTENDNLSTVPLPIAQTVITILTELTVKDKLNGENGRDIFEVYLDESDEPF